jgi:hypothetical protein
MGKCDALWTLQVAKSVASFASKILKQLRVLKSVTKHVFGPTNSPVCFCEGFLLVQRSICAKMSNKRLYR